MQQRLAQAEAAQRGMAQTLFSLTGLQACAFPAIRSATRDFHDDCKIGGGGFGAVYRCSLPLGPQDVPRAVAVKLLAQDSLQGEAEFVNEIKLLSQMSHRNVVPVLGFAAEGKRRCVVTPLYTRGSLQAALGTDRKSQLAFSAIDRIGACLDVANGIAFLHAQQPPIWHLDLKPDNVVCALRAAMGWRAVELCGRSMLHNVRRCERTPRKAGSGG